MDWCIAVGVVVVGSVVGSYCVALLIRYIISGK